MLEPQWGFSLCILPKHNLYAQHVNFPVCKKCNTKDTLCLLDLATCLSGFLLLFLSILLTILFLCCQLDWSLLCTVHHSQTQEAKCIHRLLSFCLLCLLLNSTHCPAADISVTVSAWAESPVQLHEAITQQLHAQRRLMFYSLSQYGRHTSVSMLFLLAWSRKITSEEVHKEVHYAGVCGTEPWNAWLKWYAMKSCISYGRDEMYYTTEL